MEGRPLTAREPSAQSLVETMEHVARLQLVKCTPVDSVIDRGKPSAQMCLRCPPPFLWNEFRALRPGTVVAFGRDAYNALHGREGVRWRCGTYLCRGMLEYDSNRQADLLWVPHPVASDWPQGQSALVRGLRRRPLGQK